jgi:hypothetical protein
VQLIKSLWDIAWDLWEHRKGILHEQTNHVLREEQHHVDLKIQSIYSKLLGLNPKDRYLIQSSISDTLNRTPQYKQIWLRQAEEVAKSIQLQVRQDIEARIRETNRMRQRLRSWLIGTTL